MIVYIREAYGNDIPPFCDAENCFNTPTYGIVAQDRQTGTESTSHACPAHVKDLLPEFAEAS